MGRRNFDRGWTLFEEQALVVLVHDLGPNWELVSDALGSMIHFKRVFRNAKECEERYRELIHSQQSHDDGADSTAECSQPCFELPGIPKGSARKLFERLQRPLEEDVIQWHFEKIILIGQKLHCQRKQVMPNCEGSSPEINGGVLDEMAERIRQLI